MSWVPSKKRFAQFALAACLLGEASYVAAQALILRSVGPSRIRFRPGTRVANDMVFQLRPGDSVVILARGGTRTFRGPGTFRPNQRFTPAQYASYSSARRATGAVRGPGDAGPAPRPTDVWHVDVTTPGAACVVRGQAPTLWRPSATGPVRLTITPQTGAPTTLNWAAGQSTIAWPTSVPIADGASYQFSWGAAAPNRITARLLPANPGGNLDALTDSLLANSCNRQLDVLIATRPDPLDDRPAP